MDHRIPSGDNRVVSVGNIISVRTTGLINQVTTQLLIDRIRATIATYEGKPFGVLHDITGLEGVSPGSLVILEDYLLWLNTQNFVGRAVVVRAPNPLDSFRSYIPSIEKQKEKHFTDQGRALAWLEAEIEASMGK